MKLQLLMALAGPLLRAMGQSALAERLEEAILEVAVRLKTIEDRLELVERKNDAVFRGWQLMQKARGEGGTLQDRARRAARHVGNVTGEGDDPPADHV